MKRLYKRCACGARYSLEDFAKLPRRYTQDWPWGVRHQAGQCTATIQHGRLAGKVCGSHMVIEYDIATGELVPDQGLEVEEVRGAA